MSADILEQAFASTGKVLANLQPGHLDQPTPCASWDVRALVNHIVGGTYFFAVAAETGEAPTGDDTDFAGGDPQAAYAEGSARALAAFRAPGAMEKTMKMPFGEFPGAILSTIAATDVFVHGWDLAKALGLSTDLDSGVAEQLLSASMLPDEFRGPEGQAPFGPKVEAPDTACAADRLAAHMGRQVSAS
jgi:uncharacterized protein (TIGR03086 family)